MEKIKFNGEGYLHKKHTSGLTWFFFYYSIINYNIIFIKYY